MPWLSPMGASSHWLLFVRHVTHDMTWVGPFALHHASSSLLGHAALLRPEARHVSVGNSGWCSSRSAMCLSKASLNSFSMTARSLTHSPATVHSSHHSVAVCTPLPATAAHDGWD